MANSAIKHAEDDLHDEQRPAHALEAPEPRDDERADDGARARERHHAAVVGRPPVEDVAREDRAGTSAAACRGTSSAKASTISGEDGRLVARRSRGRPRSSSSIGLRRRRRDVPDVQRHQRVDHDQERQRVEREARRPAPQRGHASTPAKSGPRTRATLNWIELSAMALGRSLLWTSDGMSDW